MTSSEFGLSRADRQIIQRMLDEHRYTVRKEAAAWSRRAWSMPAAGADIKVGRIKGTADMTARAGETWGSGDVQPYKTDVAGQPATKDGAVLVGVLNPYQAAIPGESTTDADDGTVVEIAEINGKWTLVTADCDPSGTTLDDSQTTADLPI